MLVMQTLIKFTKKPKEVIKWQFNSTNTVLYAKRQSLQTRNFAQTDVKLSMKKEGRKPEERNGYSMDRSPLSLAGS
jgi:hypothetical protein